MSVLLWFNLTSNWCHTSLRPSMTPIVSGALYRKHMEHDLADITRQSRLNPYAESMGQIIGIVDANSILASVHNDCRHDRNSRILRSTLFGSTMMYAPLHVYHEVYEHLPKFVSRSLSLEKLTARFENGYLPAMRFVTIAVSKTLDSQVLNIPDEDDHPTGHLAQLIGPVIVYSGDSDLIDPGFAQPEWREIAKATAVVAETTGEQRVTMALLSLPVEGILSGSGALGRRLGVPLWLPGVAFIALVGVGVHVVLRDPKRRIEAKVIGGKLLEAVVEHHTEIGQRRLNALQVVCDVMYMPPTGPTPLQQIAFVLARSHKPLLGQEIHDQIAKFYSTDLIPSVRTIRTVLVERSEFVRVGRYRWQFGREVGPRVQTRS